MYISPFGVVHETVSKADQPEASTGRKVAGSMLRGPHGLVAGKKGKKWRAAGNEFGYGLAGALPGSIAFGVGAATKKPGLMRAGKYASYGGGIGGGLHGTKKAQAKGYYKPQQAKP